MKAAKQPTLETPFFVPGLRSSAQPELELSESDSTTVTAAPSVKATARFQSNHEEVNPREPRICLGLGILALH